MKLVALLAGCAALALSHSARAEEKECDGSNGFCMFNCTLTETWTHPVTGAQSVKITASFMARGPIDFPVAKASFERRAALYDSQFQAASKRFDSCKTRESPCSAEAFESALEAYTRREADLVCAKHVADLVEKTQKAAAIAAK